MSDKKYVTRFAPSPTGPLHLGHAYSAITACERTKSRGGQFLLRIEDIDQTRARPQWEAQIFDDLEWLGLEWPSPVLRQSTRLAAYEDALDQLWAQGLLYPCTCNRRDILEALIAPQENTGPDGPIYPGTCRYKPRPGERPKNIALRLDMARAMDLLSKPLEFEELGQEEDISPGLKSYSTDFMISRVGDVVLARKEMGTSYHLSVVLDDAFQGVTEVIRGADLAEATPIHVLLQNLLNLPAPSYFHHRLIRDENGKRLAKRDDARAIATYRQDGLSPQDIREMLCLPHSVRS